MYVRDYLQGSENGRVVTIGNHITWKLIEEIEGTKGVIAIRKSKNEREHDGQQKRTKGQTTIYKTYT
jgi:hypothetical protein